MPGCWGMLLMDGVGSLGQRRGKKRQAGRRMALRVADRWVARRCMPRVCSHLLFVLGALPHMHGGSAISLPRPIAALLSSIPIRVAKQTLRPSVLISQSRPKAYDLGQGTMNHSYTVPTLMFPCRHGSGCMCARTVPRQFLDPLFI